LHQGADAFEQWTGRDAPVAVMERALTGATRHTVSG
jgi:shikimate 5-dehydrogenase